MIHKTQPCFLFSALVLILACCAASAASRSVKPMSLNVMAFGAKGDGKTDDTVAFQKALDAAGKPGAGVVSVPEGKYLIKGHLEFPARVTMSGIGESPNYDAGDKGSVLLAVENEGNPNGKPFIFLREKCTLKGVIINYPNQGTKNLKPYPWTIRGQGDGIAIINVYMINPWQAVDFGTHLCGAHYIKGLYAGAISRGIWVDGCLDVGRIEDVHLYPFGGWKDDIKSTMLSQGVAFSFGRTDWEYLSNCFTFGYNTGFHFYKGKHGAANVVLSQSGADDGVYCVKMDAGQGHSGVAFSNTQFMGQVWVSPTNFGPLKFSNCGFWPVRETDSFALLEGNATVTFSSCHFFDWGRTTPSAPGILAKRGSLIVSSCDFMAGKPKVTLEDGVVSAVIFGNRMRGGEKITNNSKGKVQIGFNVEE